jgi:hypothetical protein
VSKYNYKIETPFNGRMVKILEGSKQWCEGWMRRNRDIAPRIAVRLVRSDGRVVDEDPGKDAVNIGLVAGMPTAEQYERAGKEALRKAEEIREWEKRQEERRAR